MMPGSNTFSLLGGLTLSTDTSIVGSPSPSSVNNAIKYNHSDTVLNPFNDPPLTWNNLTQDNGTFRGPRLGTQPMDMFEYVATKNEMDSKSVSCKSIGHELKQKKHNLKLSETKAKPMKLPNSTQEQIIRCTHDGIRFVFMHRPSEAIKHFNQAIAMCGTNHRLLENLAYAQMQLMQLAPALMSVNQALDDVPLSKVAFLRKGQILLLDGKVTEAERMFESLATLDRDFPDLDLLKLQARVSYCEMVKKFDRPTSIRISLLHNTISDIDEAIQDQTTYRLSKKVHETFDNNYQLRFQETGAQLCLVTPREPPIEHFLLTVSEPILQYWDSWMKNHCTLSDHPLVTLMHKVSHSGGLLCHSLGIIPDTELAPNNMVPVRPTNGSVAAISTMDPCDGDDLNKWIAVNFDQLKGGMGGGKVDAPVEPTLELSRNSKTGGFESDDSSPNSEVQQIMDRQAKRGATNGDYSSASMSPISQASMEFEENGRDLISSVKDQGLSKGVDMKNQKHYNNMKKDNKSPGSSPRDDDRDEASPPEDNLMASSFQELVRNQAVVCPKQDAFALLLHKKVDSILEKDLDSGNCSETSEGSAHPNKKHHHMIPPPPPPSSSVWGSATESNSFAAIAKLKAQEPAMAVAGKKVSVSDRSLISAVGNKKSSLADFNIPSQVFDRDPINIWNYNGVRVTQVQPNITRSTLLEIFSHFGRITKIERTTCKSLEFHIFYNNSESATSAIGRLQGLIINNVSLKDKGLKLYFTATDEQAFLRDNRPKRPENDMGECYYWRTTNCMSPKTCPMMHLEVSKNIDFQPWMKLNTGSQG